MALPLQPHPDSIADCVLKTFNALPPKCKPRQLTDGRREWVPLAGIVLSKDHESSSLTCAALATGMKCLPQSKLSLAKGNVLHDWHAEVLAIRAFNRWLVDECEELARGGFKEGKEGGSAWIRWREEGRRILEKDGQFEETLENGSWQQPLELKDDISIHMYCSEAPCGDASMELTMADQEDATPWTSQPAFSPGTEEEEMLGRGNFDRLGIVRRKPARPDAPVTLSKSCSDKLAMKQVTSLLSGVSSLLVHPKKVYLSTLVLPKTQCVPEGVRRAFDTKGRMAPLAGKTWPATGYAFRPFEVRTTSKEFSFSRRAAAATGLVPSNLSALYTPRRQEILINGVLQGRKQLDPQGASCVSRKVLWKSVLDVAVLAGAPALASVLRKRSYEEVKRSNALADREEVKRHVKAEALEGWKRNDGDEAWSLEDS